MNSTPAPTANEALEQSSRTKLPSWLISLLLHGGILTFIALGYGRIAPVDRELSEGEYREVGIYIKDVNTATDQTTAEENQTETEEVPKLTQTTPAQQSFQDPQESESPPVTLTQPDITSNILGPGAALPSPPTLNSSTQQSVVKPSEVLNNGPQQTATNSTEFFGIRDEGLVFVYLVDCSGSMSASGGPNQPTAMQVAKGELLASLRNLNPRQKFQVLFYNTGIKAFSLRNHQQETRELVAGSNINITQAAHFIQGISPDLGTDHMRALRTALSLKPDVIYFLTDTDTSLQPADLNQLRQENKRLNSGKTRIHCIEFGKYGEPIGEYNFLKQLASDNNGTYRYRDITTFTYNTRP